MSNTDKIARARAALRAYGYKLPDNEPPTPDDQQTRSNEQPDQPLKLW